MITHSGRYIEVQRSFSQHLHLFNNGKNLNALAVFMFLTMSQDDNGWACPDRAAIKSGTGLRNNQAVADALSFLRHITINGLPILHQYRRYGRGACYYHVFPNAGGIDKPPVDGLVLWEGSHT